MIRIEFQGFIVFGQRLVQVPEFAECQTQIIERIDVISHAFKGQLVTRTSILEMPEC